jgi:hypothetical protein
MNRKEGDYDNLDGTKLLLATHPSPIATASHFVSGLEKELAFLSDNGVNADLCYQSRYAQERSYLKFLAYSMPQLSLQPKHGYSP